jgi:hypothetical protein
LRARDNDLYKDRYSELRERILKVLAEMNRLRQELDAFSPLDDPPKQMTAEEWVAFCKKAALSIDPETAEVAWAYADCDDPYCVYPDRPVSQIGREYYARSPGGVWVWFGDLSEKTRDALEEKRKSCSRAGVAVFGFPEMGDEGVLPF